jgi:hypothetical protein
MKWMKFYSGRGIEKRVGRETHLSRPCGDCKKEKFGKFLAAAY